MGSLAKGSLWKVCGNSAESSRTIRFIAPGKGAEILRKVCGNLRKIFCNDPFPNDPISVVLKRESLGEAFLLTVGAFLLTVKLPCLQSLKPLIRRTFPLLARKLQL